MRYWYISVHYQKMPSLPWGGPTKQIDIVQIQLQNIIDYIEVDDGYHFVELTPEMMNATEFGLLVRAWVIDSRGCYGKDANVTYKCK